MKKLLFPLLLASLAGNAAFALVFGLGSSAAPEASRATVIAGATKPATPVIDAKVWPGLKTDDLPALVARLRAAGFPQEIVRAIIGAQIGKLYEARIKALQPASDRQPFWKDAQPNPQNEIALRKLYREQQKAVNDLLGEDPNSAENIYATQQGGRVDFLPKEKAADILRIVKDYNDRRADLYAGGTYDAVRDKIAALDKAQHDAIAANLTPQELLDYDLRNGNNARTLRFTLSAFTPSEAEFRAIYQARQAFDEKYSGINGFIALSQAQMQERTEADNQLKAQIKALLTPERAAEYDRSMDYYYRETDKLVSRLDLPKDTTLSLWNIKQDMEKRRQEISTATTNPAERSAQLTALQQEAIAKVTPLLGNAGLVETYKGYGGGWLANLAPRPAPKPKG
jgi:hypothetical protein